MNQIARSDWLPERARWSDTARSGFLAWSRKIKDHFWCFKSYNKSFIDQDCSVKMTGYWPRSFFACLWTSTSSRSINTQKKNLANIQSSWPHAWSITHTYLTGLLGGEASTAVTGLSFTEGNYGAGVEILTKRFGDEQKIISAYMEMLLKLPPVGFA